MLKIQNSNIFEKKYKQGLAFFSKVHWSRTSEHQESTDPENFSTGPEYRNGGANPCLYFFSNILEFCIFSMQI
jgi:hypothetical protein